MKKYWMPAMMLAIFEAVAITLWLSKDNLFYLFNFSYIGLSICIGQLLFICKYEHARRIVQLLIGLYMLIYLGIISNENMQMEGFWYYLFTGAFEAATIHYAVAKIFGKSNEDIKEVLTTFSGVRHRTQYVTTLNGRKFYNDSKATNMEATEKALAGFNNPVVLLAGGLDRGFTFEKLEPSLKNKVHAMIVFGETADLMAKAGKEAGVEKIIKTKDAVSAVPEAYKVSNEGDVILLSPACASWDQWPTFEVRGDKFIEAVEKLTEELEEK